jgi:S-adenosylmethionine hydrolase
MAIITLTSDFGTRDGYVGAVKGVIMRLAPTATVVDIAHDVPRGDVAHAAWVVATSTLEFPAGTIHIVVVDPGVGSDRPAVIARVPASGLTEKDHAMQLYVGPDNGVFSYLPIDTAWLIRPDIAPDASATFHGRDVFARTAAAMLKGWPQVYGADTSLRGQLPWGPRHTGAGHVVHFDHFGNAITDLPVGEAGRAVRLGDRILPLVRTYSDVGHGEVLAYIGSADTVEIGVRDGSAATALKLQRGMVVEADQGVPRGPYR